MTEETPEYDKVTEASLNGIYVKAQEMDRGHNEQAAPDTRPPGALADAEAHASTHASTHASEGADAETRASDAESHASDAESHASD